MTERSGSRKGWIRWAVRCIGFVIFGVLLYKIGPDKIWNTITGVRVGYFAVALPIFFVMIGVKSVKTWFLLRTRVDILDLYRLNAFGFSVGSITPGRLGEFSKVVFLSQHRVPIPEAFAATLIDRLSDVGLMIACAVGGLYVFYGPAAGWIGLGLTLMIGVFAVAAFFSDRLLGRVTRGKLRELVDLEGRAIRTFIAGISLRVWFITAALTAVYLGFYFLQMWVLARGLHLPISYIQTTMAISASAVPAILPISIFNVGPRDAVLASIFDRMGWGAQGGIALSTLILVLFLVNGIFGLMFLPRRPAA